MEDEDILFTNWGGAITEPAERLVCTECIHYHDLKQYHDPSFHGVTGPFCGSQPPRVLPLVGGDAECNRFEQKQRPTQCTECVNLHLHQFDGVIEPFCHIQGYGTHPIVGKKTDCNKFERKQPILAAEIFRSSTISTPPARSPLNVNGNMYNRDMWNTTITTTTGGYPVPVLPDDPYNRDISEILRDEQDEDEIAEDSPEEGEGVAPSPRDMDAVEAERAKRFGASLEIERVKLEVDRAWRIAKEASAVLAEAKILVAKLIGALGQQEEEELQARLDAIEEELGEETIGV